MFSKTGIAIFVYNRPKHAKKVFSGLKKNPEFKNMPVRVFGDGKRNTNDSQWDEMRIVAEQFAKENPNVKLEYNDKNLGCRISIINGITKMLEKYESVIVIEDDIYISDAFLNFILKGLDYYKDIKNVACICGYNHPPQLMEIPDEYQEDIYFSLRTGSWGWATWRDRWTNIDWDLKDYKELKNNKKLIKEFHMFGSDLFEMLEAQAMGKLNAWDIAWTWHCFKNKLYTVYPVESFVENIGHDGSGENSKASDKQIFANKNLNRSRDIKFIKTPYIDPDITRNFRNIYRRGARYYFRKVMSKVRLFLKV